MKQCNKSHTTHHKCFIAGYARKIEQQNKAAIAWRSGYGGFKMGTKARRGDKAFVQVRSGGGQASYQTLDAIKHDQTPVVIICDRECGFSRESRGL